MKSEQFLRITRLLGENAVHSLHEKHVVLVGLGAVGGMCLESLVRSGIGTIRIVDFDTVGITNLNRQILATYDSLGRLKTEVAAERVKAINPDCKLEALPLFVQQETLGQILEGDIDLVIDAIDSLNPKCSLLQEAYNRNIPVVSSMGAALRRDPFLVRKADLMDTYGCPLARAVRTNLRKRGVGRGIDVIYSPELVQFTYHRQGKKAQRTGKPSHRHRRLRPAIGAPGPEQAVGQCNAFRGRGLQSEYLKVLKNLYQESGTPQPRIALCFGRDALRDTVHHHSV